VRGLDRRIHLFDEEWFAGHRQAQATLFLALASASDTVLRTLMPATPFQSASVKICNAPVLVM
jgi:hypothetical protein